VATSTLSPKTRRFRVALSYPGEYRARVEKIAEALGARLGRDRVLYDKWHAPEFAQPNLNVYLANLYHKESDLIVAFLCKEYEEKEWCGLEWRAVLDLLKRKESSRLMLLRLDNAEIPGLYSIDGYLDIAAMSDADVAAAILSRLEPRDQQHEVFRAFTAKLPAVNPLLIGREKELAFLDAAWAEPHCNFVQVIAAGGTGKTALMDKWFRRHLGEADVFGWSFYSQGSAADRQTSSDDFFTNLLSWLGIAVEQSASIYIKAAKVAERLRERRLLLLLDGVEPLQESDGRLRDLPLKALLQELETDNRGLVVCTTRVRIDLPDDGPRVQSTDLDNLTPEQGAEYLRMLEVEGTDEELLEASGEYWSHALALTLLGTYLVDFCDGDIRRRDEIERLAEDDNPGRVIRAYEKMFAGRPEADLLRALGYFDRPAEPAALKLVLPEMKPDAYRKALVRLQKARLILSADPNDEIDCHPLIREHFAAQTTAEGHTRLYEHYQNAAPERPDTLEEMRPLFYAVYHGCKAGRHQEALAEVFHDRVLRRNQAYLVYSLGAMSTSLSLLANFFEAVWTVPVASLEKASGAWIIGNAGYSLRALGRLADAVGPTRSGAEACVGLEDWTNASVYYGNLSEVYLVLGRVSDAKTAAQQAIYFADREGSCFRKMTSRSKLACALHHAGDLAGAERLFVEGERVQAEDGSKHPILYSLAGFWYCDLLVDQGKNQDAIQRVSHTLALAERNHNLLSIGLDHLSLGRAHPPGSPEAADHLDQAVGFLRRSSQLQYLPLALLARRTPRDLEEACRIATRSDMKLFLADYHLAMGNLDEAEKLINETGYHRRDKQLAELRKKLA
jgi:hypothetical protein